MNFSEIVREILLEHAVGPERPTPASLTRCLAPEADRYLDHVQFDPGHYVRHPVLLWEDWEVMVIGWEAGQVTPIHDHRGVLGGMAILSGTVVEERIPWSRIELRELAYSAHAAEGDLSIRTNRAARSCRLSAPFPPHLPPPLRTMASGIPGRFQESASVFQVHGKFLVRDGAVPGPVAPAVS